jgi:hypothetical protein
MTNDYNLLAQAVDCPRCGAKKGEKCHGARPDTRTVQTHFLRRRAAVEARKSK